MIKIPLLIYEGISGSGKSSLLTEMMHHRNFDHYALHRASATQWVYGSLGGRDIPLKAIHEWELSIQKIQPVVLVLMTCNPKIALERKLALGDQHIETNLKEAQELFQIYFKEITKFEAKIYLSSESEMKNNVEFLNTNMELYIERFYREVK